MTEIGFVSCAGGTSSLHNLPNMAESAVELQKRLLHKRNHAPVQTSGCGGATGASEATAGDMEQMHDGLGFVQYMIAGSIAGMVEHMAMFPVDTLKTRMQMMADASRSAHSSLARTFTSILKIEGPLGLYRGIGAMGLGAGPAHAVYFSVYEICKERFGGNRRGHHPLAHGAAGVVATVASDAVLTPMDVVKQRLQLFGNGYNGVKNCIERILREEGIKAFYASYRTTVIMNAPFTATHFSTYEASKKGLKSIWPERANEENLVVHVVAGGVAGALASAVTTPLDVVKTRLQCQVHLDFLQFRC